MFGHVYQLLSIFVEGYLATFSAKSFSNLTIGFRGCLILANKGNRTSPLGTMFFSMDQIHFSYSCRKAHTDDLSHVI